jgi:hypothetical protein
MMLKEGKEIVKTKLNKLVEATKSHADKLKVLSPILKQAYNDLPKTHITLFEEMTTHKNIHLLTHNHVDDEYPRHPTNFKTLPAPHTP